MNFRSLPIRSASLASVFAAFLSTVLSTVLALSSLTESAPAMAADAWPTKPITLVVPFPPGGSTDTLARAVSPVLQQSLGQNVIVDNKPGATGTIGMGQVRRAAPDGHTLICSSLGPYVIAPHLYRSVPYDPRKDLDLITVAVRAQNVLVVPTSSPYTSAKDVVDAMKAKPEQVSFASSGTGSSDHLTAALLWQVTGTKGVHVPYKGGGPAITDLIGGQVDTSFQNVSSVSQHIAAGKLRALAVTGDRRDPQLPDVPTLDELGIKGVDVYSWQAFAAPKGLKPEVRSRVHSAIVDALKNPEVAQRLEKMGFEIVANTPEEFAAFQKREYDRWKEVVTKGDIKAE